MEIDQSDGVTVGVGAFGLISGADGGDGGQGDEVTLFRVVQDLFGLGKDFFLVILIVTVFNGFDSLYVGQ